MKQRFFILLLIGLACCTAKEETVLPPVKLIVNVVDTSNNPLTFNVPVYLFNNLKAFNAASAYYTGTGAMLTDTAVNGQCIFSGIPTTTNYYVYSHYRNYGVLEGGYYIDYDNSDNFSVDQQAFLVTPVAGTTPQVSAKIVMKPVDGLVSFWTLNVNNDALPIQVYVDNNLFGTINTTFNSQPIYTVSGVLNGLVRKGAHTYTATSSNCSGCRWEVNPPLAVEGSQISIEIPACSSGTAIFWTDSTNSDILPIDIIRSDSNIVVATITSANSVVPDFASTNAKISDNAGTYYYTAQSRTNKNCFWTGYSYTITAGQCNSVKISTCGE